MGSNSFLVFNPGKANQETDAEYLANATRLAGAVTGLFPSVLANKIFYQASIMAAAWGEVFKGLGFTVADTDFNALVAILTTILTKAGGNLTGAINETYATLASGSTVNIGAANANFIVITGNSPIIAFDTIQEGTRRILYFAGEAVLTHNTTSLILPGAENITTQPKACAEFISLGAGNWVCSNYSSDLFQLKLDGDTLTLSEEGLKVTDDVFAFLAGEDAQPFSAANGTEGKQVINISQFVASKISKGYQKIPGGLIFQWGVESLAPVTVTNVTLPTPFPTSFLQAFASLDESKIDCDHRVGAGIISNSVIQLQNSCPHYTHPLRWLAIGY